MDNPRAEKVAVVDEVRQRFGQADAAILTEYRGLKVKELAELRRSLTPLGGDYKVYKNTLVRFAARDSGLSELEPLLDGPTAVAFVNGDAAAVAKALRDFSRTQPLLVIKGGVLGDKILSSADTTALAELPSRDVLLARFAGGLAAPLSQLAGLLQALPRNLAFGLAALRDQLGASSPSPPEGSQPTGQPGADAAPSAATSEDVAPEPLTAEAPTGTDAPEGADAAAEAAGPAEAAEAPAEADGPAEAPAEGDATSEADATPEAGG